MSFPKNEEIERIRKKLKNAEATHSLPENASKVQKLKYDLCKQFVKYVLKHSVVQKELAFELGIDPARLNEILKYRIDLFTVDRLLNYVELLKPSVKVTVA